MTIFWKRRLRCLLFYCNDFSYSSCCFSFKIKINFFVDNFIYTIQVHIFIFLFQKFETKMLKKYLKLLYLNIGTKSRNKKRKKRSLCADLFSLFISFIIHLLLFLQHLIFSYSSLKFPF